MRESKVIEKIKKLFLSTFDKCSFTKINISPIHGRGFPDLLIVTEYATFFIEAKAPGGKPTKLQRAKLIEIKKAGQNSVRCYWATVKNGTANVLVFMDPETDEVMCEICTPDKRSSKKRIQIS
jgi:hypothetical protein